MSRIAIAIAFSGIVIAAAIGFDDVELSDYQLRFARFLATVGGGAAVLISAVRYLWERQQELAWQKTEFMIDLFREFEREDPLRRAQSLLDQAIAIRNDDQLKRILGPVQDLDEDEKKDRNAIDRYLDFFDHLYTYVFITKTLSPRDVTSFSGYVIDIMDSKTVSDFAFEWGYEDVLRLAIYFRDEAAKERRAEDTDRLKAEVAAKRQSWLN